jgi:uncharacterized membrane protein
VPANGTSTFAFNFVAAGSGPCNYAALVHSTVSGSQVLTDAQDWTATFDSLTKPASPWLAVTNVNAAALPAGVVGGAKFTQALPVNLTNVGASAARGRLTIQVYASTSPSWDAPLTLVATASRSATLQVNTSRSFPVKLGALPASLASGNYYLLVKVIDVNGNQTAGSSSQAINVASPLMSVSAGIGAVTPSSTRAGGHANVAMSLTNIGNEDLLGKVTIRLALSVDGINVLPAFEQKTQTVRVNAGTALTLHLAFKMPNGHAPGKYYLAVTVLQAGAQLASAVGTEPFTLA